MTTHITYRQTANLELNGNLITGDTFKAKDYIRNYLAGKWNADAKGWNVDLSLVEKWIDQPGSAIQSTPTEVVTKTATVQSASNRNALHAPRWCPKCHDYCFGDCDV
jgi:hypothetical protein